MMKFNAFGYELEISARKEWHTAASEQDTVNFMKELALFALYASQLHKETSPAVSSIYKADMFKILDQVKGNNLIHI